MSGSFSPQPGRPEAAAIVWQWREKEDAPNSAHGRLRLIGIAQGLVGVTVGITAHVYGFQKIGTLAIVIACSVTLAALLSPTGLYASMQRLFVATGRVAGRGATWLVMVPLFYCIFWPFGLLMRRGRQDRMKRYYDHETESYWEPRPQRQADCHERPY